MNTTPQLFSQLPDLRRLRGQGSKIITLLTGDRITSELKKSADEEGLTFIRTFAHEPWTDGQPSYQKFTLFANEQDGITTVTWKRDGWFSGEDSAAIHFNEYNQAAIRIGQPV
jgi:hypothetical protein